jgi:hypothetical protein
MLYLYRKNPCDIKQYVLYGERHSGTKFLSNIFNKIFNLPLSEGYGHKHFFGFIPNETIYDAKTTLFVGIIRNPYDWVAAMNSLPHHTPSHLIPIYDHLLDEWYSIGQYYRVFDKKAYTIDKSTKEIIEDKDFKSKQRYSNILAMRNQKMDYLINILPLLACNYVLISYESLISNIGLYINAVSTSYKLNVNNKNIKYSYINQAPKRILSRETEQIITNNLNWNIENQIGYAARNAIQETGLDKPITLV